MSRGKVDEGAEVLIKKRVTTQISSASIWYVGIRATPSFPCKDGGVEASESVSTGICLCLTTSEEVALRRMRPLDRLRGRCATLLLQRRIPNMRGLAISAAIATLLAAPAFSQSTPSNPTGHVGSGQRAGGPAHENIPANPAAAPANPRAPQVSPLQTGSGQRSGGPAREAISETGGTPRPTNPPTQHIGSGQRAGGPAHESAPANRR